MELITRPLTKRQIFNIIENDEIPFKIYMSKNAISRYEKCEREDYANILEDKISKAVIGTTGGIVVCWRVSKEISPHLLEIEGRLNVADFLFGGASCSEDISEWERECYESLIYSCNNKDLYEGSWD